MSDRGLNAEAAGIFRECAGLLRQQKANPFRINAYLRAAATLESLDSDARDILAAKGVDGLTELAGIGKGLAAAIEEIARTGGLAQLRRLRGEASPEQLFRAVPGIGPKLARDIHDTLHVDTLEGLELAAHDGSLQAVPGIGARRAAAIRAAVASTLARDRPGRDRHGRDLPGRTPPVDLLLAVDREYRRRAQAGSLPTIAPRRFNPGGEAWLPVLHAERRGWHFTALYSNTARAHELGRTRDWVVLYFYDDDHREGQCTIVTETRGPLAGERVVRGREAECRALRDR